MGCASSKDPDARLTKSRLNKRRGLGTSSSSTINTSIVGSVSGHGSSSPSTGSPIQQQTMMTTTTKNRRSSNNNNNNNNSSFHRHSSQTMKKAWSSSTGNPLGGMQSSSRLLLNNKNTTDTNRDEDSTPSTGAYHDEETVPEPFNLPPVGCANDDDHATNTIRCNHCGGGALLSPTSVSPAAGVLSATANNITTNPLACGSCNQSLTTTACACGGTGGITASTSSTKTPNNSNGEFPKQHSASFFGKPEVGQNGRVVVAFSPVTAATTNEHSNTNNDVNNNTNTNSSGGNNAQDQLPIWSAMPPPDRCFYSRENNNNSNSARGFTTNAVAGGGLSSSQQGGHPSIFDSVRSSDWGGSKQQVSNENNWLCVSVGQEGAPVGAPGGSSPSAFSPTSGSLANNSSHYATATLANRSIAAAECADSGLAMPIITGHTRSASISNTLAEGSSTTTMKLNKQNLELLNSQPILPSFSSSTNAVTLPPPHLQHQPGNNYNNVSTSMSSSQFGNIATSFSNAVRVSAVGIGNSSSEPASPATPFDSPHNNNSNGSNRFQQQPSSNASPNVKAPGAAGTKVAFSQEVVAKEDEKDQKKEEKIVVGDQSHLGEEELRMSNLTAFTHKTSRSAWAWAEATSQTFDPTIPAVHEDGAISHHDTTPSHHHNNHHHLRSGMGSRLGSMSGRSSAACSGNVSSIGVPVTTTSLRK